MEVGLECTIYSHHIPRALKAWIINVQNHSITISFTVEVVSIGGQGIF